jgi:hypothetical protein
MSIRAGINQLRRRLPERTGGECHGIRERLYLLEDDEPFPPTPICSICGRPHWPTASAGVPYISVVRVVRGVDDPEAAA